jgi:uncharacterized protein
MDTLALLVFLGVLAGALTTVAGMGGGLVLLLVLALVWDPARALACTAPALLVGNLHRLWLFRDAVDRPRLRAFAFGALPGAIGGGLLVAAVDARVIQGVLIATTLLSVVRAVFHLDWRVPTPSLAPAGAVVGALTGTSGGAGLLVSPVLLSTGLTGTAYIATVAGCAVAMHAGRIVGYAFGGLFTTELLALAAVATAAILAGNLLGKRLRQVLSCVPESLIEHGVLAVCVALAVLGIGH